MTRDRANMDHVMEELRRLRDELRVRMHLAKAEARDEWVELEKKFEHLRGRLDVVGKAAKESAGDVGDALELVGQELRKGYEKIRKLL